MNTQHTPGPWKTAGWLPDTIECQQMIVTDSPSPMVIATVFHDISTGEANARLIAAAPELLQALRGLVDAFDGQTECTEILDMIGAKDSFVREAIAKATQP